LVPVRSETSASGAEQDRHEVARTAGAFLLGDGVDSALFDRHGLVSFDAA
jgi:hypothetical protein